MSGQMRELRALTASNASRLATRRSSLVPACLLKASSARRDWEFHSPLILIGVQPTRWSCTCNSRASSPESVVEACGGGLELELVVATSPANFTAVLVARLITSP